MSAAAASPAVALAPAPLALPRARALTDALVRESPSHPALVTAPRLADRLGRVVGNAVAQADPVSIAEQGRRPPDATRCVRIGAYQLISIDRTTSPLMGSEAGDAETFRWTARRARRTIGLAALRLVLEQRVATPADGVAALVGHPGGLGAPGVGALGTHEMGTRGLGTRGLGTRGLGTHGPGSCAEWLDSLPSAARAAVRAEATTWATQLWSALEWERLGPAPIVGRADRWWACGNQVRVALRGRADVRLFAGGGAHLSMLPGQPTAESRVALCLSALVELCARGPSAVPARVAGWWPEAGKAWIVPIDDHALVAVATLAARAAATVARSIP